MATVDRALVREIALLHTRVCSALGDPKRLLMLYALEAGPRCVGELATDLGLAQPAVSRHLRVLRERSLVTVERRGPSSYYAIADRRLVEAVDLLRGVLAARLDAEQRIERTARAVRASRASHAAGATRTDRGRARGGSANRRATS